MAEGASPGNPEQNVFASINEKAVVSRARRIIGRDVRKIVCGGHAIGNLEDITVRALRVLKEVDLVAAEDTRHTGLLLHHFGIDVPQQSYHKFNESQRQADFLQRLQDGGKIALVSDAGMPGVSDPGERLIRACVAAGIDIEVVPGPSAVLHALVGSGLKITPFYFGGFLPVKGGGEAEGACRSGRPGMHQCLF